MSLALTVLGCGGTYAGPGNACSGYLVDDGETTLWLDAGPGTAANAQNHVDLADVDAIVLSHEHPDHWLDLPILRNVYRYVLGLERPVPVYGTAGNRERADALIGEVEPTFAWTTIDASSEVEVGGLRLSFSLTDHPVETLAARVEGGGRSFVYTADTGPGWTPDALGLQCDAVLCEATMTDADSGTSPHLTGGEAGAAATRSDAGRLLLTHLLPGSSADVRRDEAAATFTGPVEVVEPNRRYDL